MQINKKAARKAAQHIFNGFSWVEVNESYEYWEGVYIALKRYSGGVETYKLIDETKTKKRASKAAKNLVKAFLWSEAKEGCNYWHGVYFNLLRIAKNAKGTD